MNYPISLPSEQLGFKKIIYTKQNGVATVTINRPEVLNALNFPTLKEMSRAFEDASYDDAVGVLVLTGTGDRAFCTGADLGEQEQFLYKRSDYWKWMGSFIEAHDRLRNIGKPTVARLNGMVVGGGNEFNIACDLAIAADHVTIRQVGTSRGSVPAGGATQWLPMIVGDRRAREILWLNEPLSAEKALDWGLVNQVVKREELDSAVQTVAGKLLQKMPEVLRYAKQQTNFWRDFAWSMTIGHARDWLSIHADSEETAEGLDAFYNKRPVDYERLRAAMSAGKKCSNCGKSMPGSFAYCGSCGTALREAENG
ncbi:MAG: enoyl-CoA hydratase/isomerase family protein [Chloroflexi bacterium]|nr:enoyl-CoA hydratase/isomerase family protein [Chloroflexota bacterium]